MKPSLQMNFSQQLTLTPQLQQAIRLLQLSSLELEHEIQEYLCSNVMLEAVDNENNAEPEVNANAETQANQTEVKEQNDTNLNNEIAEDSWRPEQYSSFQDYPSSNTKNFDDDDLPQDNLYKTSTSLQEHLIWQMQLAPFTERQQIIALAIIDAIEEDGYLNTSIDELHTALIEYLANIQYYEIEQVLKMIQNFEPAGVGARSVRECLLLQINQLPDSTPWLQSAKKIIDQHLDLLGQHQFKTLQRILHLDEEQLRETVHLIHSLNPHPGFAMVKEQPDYVIPDVLVNKINGRWVVELNQSAISHIRINQKYASLVQRANDSPNNQLLKSHLQEARWFIKSLESRNETLLKVSQFIVDYQREFFEKGEEAMKPLVLHEIARQVDMHESTISRITTKKYMFTPRGMFELKYFFSSHLDTDNGEECSSTAIRALIKKLIHAEDKSHPLSDLSIANQLAKQGIHVARRTVAKYREAMHIPSSHERRSI